jgi:putative component of toxin-antitoxin plasmid stabilization module
MGGIFELAVEMGSGAVIYVPSFMKTGSGIQKLMGGGGIHIHTDSNAIS